MPSNINVRDFYKLSVVAGKGLGCIATSEVIPAGTCILREKPLVSVALSENGDLHGQLDKVSGEFRSLQLDTELRKLSDEDLCRFYSLTDVFQPPQLRRKTNFGIMKTNSFSVTLAGDPAVLFPEIARINHSCLPNCHHYWTGRSGEFVVRAARDIRKGDEICISYMSPLQRADFHNRESRRAILQEDFGFHCLCELCTIAPDVSSQEKAADSAGALQWQLLADNDMNRQRILEIENMWSDLGSHPEVAIDLGEEQFQLCCQLHFQVGLLSYVALHCVEAASLLVARKRSGINAEAFREKAIKYARKACQYGQVAYGEDSEEFKIFQTVVDVCETASNQELLVEVQVAIASLRDIDS